jgi:hypothetical protein
MKLNPISKEEPAEEWMRRKRKSSEKEGEEKYPESCGWLGHNFGPGDVDFRRVILQDANLRGILQVLLQELSMDLVAHSGHVGIGGLGLGFLRDGRGGADGGGSSFAHGGGAQEGTLAEWKQGYTGMAGRVEEDDEGGGVG